jgi:SPP1 gp7 family putative phage head morphogenesis protein
VDSPEALTIRNQIRLAAQVDQIGARAARLLERASIRMARQLQGTSGIATSQALQAQLAQIQGILQQAGDASYQQFVNDVAGQLKSWEGMSIKEARLAVTSAIDQGLKLNDAGGAGPAGGAGIGTAGSTIFSEQALKTASTMGPLELTIAAAKGKQTYSLESEFAKAFLSPNGKPLKKGFQDAVDHLQSIFDGSVRSAVVTGQTTASLAAQLIGDGKKISGQLAPPIRNLQTLARTGAQQVANAIQYDQLQINPAVEEVVYVATLDQRTSPFCRLTDGKVFPIDKAPRPPTHMNCRSTLAAHFPGAEKGSRSMTMALVNDDGSVTYVGAFDKKIQDRLSPEQQALLAKNRSGKGVTYQDWLKAQPLKAQQQILGTQGAATFAKTGSLTKATPLAVKNQLKTIVPKQGPKPAAAKPAPIPAAAPTAAPKPAPAKPAVKAAAAPAATAKPAKAAPTAATQAMPASAVADKPPAMTKIQKITADAKQLIDGDPMLKTYHGLPIAKNTIVPGKYPLPQALLDEMASGDKASEEFWKNNWLGWPKEHQYGVLQSWDALVTKAKAAPLPTLPTPAAPVVTPKPAKASKAPINAPAPPAKAAVSASTGKELRSNHLSPIAAGDQTTDLISASFSHQQLGVSPIEHQEIKDAVKAWSGSDYGDMRGMQVLARQKEGFKLNAYEQKIADRADRMADGAKKLYGAQVDKAEDFIRRAPKYDGAISRGLGLPGDKDLSDLIDKFTSEDETFTMESWSTSKTKAENFATQDRRDIEVILEVKQNLHGAPIMSMSSFRSEKEVLLPSRVRYRFVEQRESTPTYGSKRVIITLEQIP